MTQTSQNVAADIGRQIGLARAAKNNGDEGGARNHAEAALQSLKNVELNYENLDWRQLAEGDAHFLLGDLAAAEKAYRQAMVAAPQQSGGYQRLAELLNAMGRKEDLEKHMDICNKKFPSEQYYAKMQGINAAANKDFDTAIPLLAKAFAANDSDHEVADAMGSCLQNISHYDEAVLYHARALELNPTNADYAVRYGLAFAGSGEGEAAEQLFSFAIDLNPNCIDAYAYLGYVQQNQGRLDEARKTFETALERAPDHPNLNFVMGRLMQETGDKDAALKHYQVTQDKQGMEAPVAEFLSASIKGENPEAPPEQFVRGLFDFFAPKFETSLLNDLRYRSPAVLRDLLLKPEVRKVRDITSAHQRILDLGCGTGLMGVVIKEYAAKLAGVDLSHNMLIRANEKGIYDQTRRQDITAYVNEMPNDAFDLIVAADVLIYIGNLQPIFTALSQKMKPGSLLAFSCEKLPEDGAEQGYKLQSHVRYAQKDSYVRKLASDYGFEVLAMDESAIRQQAGKPVDGFHYVLAKK